MMPMKETKNRLKDKGHNRQILALLKRSRKPLTAYAILDKLHATGIKAPTTVYRALTALTEKGLVHRIESLNAFIACQHHDAAHSHGGQFAICTQCGTVQEIAATVLTTPSQATGHGFLSSVQRQMIEVSGICHGCSGR